ncbi:MAG TPA: S1/P1 nuclease [Phycisphaerae bacterium]|nr:S1/P1 nuclease [Phycisphaerae bacterium]
MTMTCPESTHRAGPASTVALLRVLAVSLIAATAGAGWGRDAHHLVTREALLLLPPPLSDEFGQGAALENVLAKVMSPDRRVDQLRAEAQQLQDQADAADESHKADLASKANAAWAKYRQERSRHFFDIDAMTDEPPPFAAFPRDRRQAALKAAEHLLQHDPRLAAELLGEDPDHPATKLDAADRSRWPQLGEAALARHGTLPWVIRDQVTRLTEAFRQKRRDRIEEAMADLSHFVGDLHQPLHTTRNYDGQMTGNRGIHAAFEIYLVIRRKTLSLQDLERLPPELLSPYDAVDDVVAAAIEQAGRNAEWTGRLLAADTEARRRSGITDEDVAYLKALDRDAADELFRRKDAQGLDGRQRRLLRHVDELGRILSERHDDLPRLAMGRAASMLSSLVYTAWLRAGRPNLATTAGDGAPADAKPKLISFDLVVFGAMAALLLAMLLRRRRRPPTPPL